MSVLPNQLRITELDYDQILVNLVEFMKTDPAFADYDFGGSGLRLLARVLAYTTFYSAYYVTQAANESFLDTAQLRASVAAHARMLGYDIKGTQSARLNANVAVQLNNTSADQIALPKNSAFTLVANSAFTFYNTSDATLTKNTATLLYEGTDIALVEGHPLTYRFTVDINDPIQRFVVPNANIDFATMTVRVQASASSNVQTTFVRNSNYLTIAATDPVFFVREATGGVPELTFGNDVVGRALAQGNIVIVDYYVSRGDAGNNIRGPFSVAANVSGFLTGITIANANTTPSSGGTDAEDLDTARFLAPLTYQSQNRCVTAQDYKAIILAQYGEHIAAINVFGGEQGNPSDPSERPVPGKVFIALKPKIGLRFTDVVKSLIEQTIIKPRSVIGIVPQVIDPDYIYLNVATSVKYDAKAATRTALQLETAIANNIFTFAQNSVEKFDTAFRFSRFTRIIDDTDAAILSSLTRIDLEKRVFPLLGVTNQYTLKFSAPLRRSGDSSLVLEPTSHRFSHSDATGTVIPHCFFYEQGGMLHVAYRNATSQSVVIVKANVGTVNIDTGLISVSFLPTAIENNALDIRLTVVPSSNDFVPRLNQLFTVDAESVRVQLLNDATGTQADRINFFAGGILP